MIASGLLPLLYLYEPSLTILLFAELFALCLTWGTRTVAGAKEKSRIHGIAFHNCQMWVKFCVIFENLRSKYFSGDLFSCQSHPISWSRSIIYGANSNSRISVRQLNTCDVSLVQAIQLLNCLHFPSSLNTRKNLNLNHMRSAVDFKPGGHGQREDHFTVSIATAKKHLLEIDDQIQLSLKYPSAELCSQVCLIQLLQWIITYILFVSKVEISVERTVQWEEEDKMWFWNTCS